MRVVCCVLLYECFCVQFMPCNWYPCVRRDFLFSSTNQLQEYAEIRHIIWIKPLKNPHIALLKVQNQITTNIRFDAEKSSFIQFHQNWISFVKYTIGIIANIVTIHTRNFELSSAIVSITFHTNSMLLFFQSLKRTIKKQLEIREKWR